ncbi:hypothetical protein HaLaN_08572 [Haematococcus lacustris]|uniref:Uncharacterized protein n=1 Tax=Haematococcus lacustris TaxID=44745 RepID=A0A699YRC4_HAELA|nr:hypothetical protein HaLaN_08572 [Haematococcus lacustris]
MGSLTRVLGLRGGVVALWLYARLSGSGPDVSGSGAFQVKVAEHRGHARLWVLWSNIRGQAALGGRVKRGHASPNPACGDFRQPEIPSTQAGSPSGEQQTADVVVHGARGGGAAVCVRHPNLCHNPLLQDGQNQAQCVTQLAISQGWDSDLAWEVGRAQDTEVMGFFISSMPGAPQGNRQGDARPATT